MEARHSIESRPVLLMPSKTRPRRDRQKRMSLDLSTRSRRTPGAPRIVVPVFGVCLALFGVFVIGRKGTSDQLFDLCTYHMTRRRHPSRLFYGQPPDSCQYSAY